MTINRKKEYFFKSCFYFCNSVPRVKKILIIDRKFINYKKYYTETGLEGQSPFFSFSDFVLLDRFLRTISLRNESFILQHFCHFLRKPHPTYSLYKLQ